MLPVKYYREADWQEIPNTSDKPNYCIQHCLKNHNLHMVWCYTTLEVHPTTQTYTSKDEVMITILLL